jgi:pimeloyl-ACP methyl ester carboxylesterase
MVKQQRAYIATPAPQRQIHARYAGTDGPHVFLFHQLPLSCRQFERAIPVLGEFCQAYGLDLPGYGSSPPPPGPLSLAEYATRLVHAIEAVGARRLVLIGLEIGVAVALEVARLVGWERVSHFVAMATPPLAPEARRAFVGEIGEPQFNEDGSHALPMWRRFQRRWGANAENAMLRMAFTENHNVYHRYHWGLRAFADYDLAAGLRSIRCPALFLWAELDPMTAGDAAASKLVAGSQHVVIAGARPALATTERDKFVSAVAEFAGIERQRAKA